MNDDDTPEAGVTKRHTARRRVEKACDTCRRRKERCNGARPECSTCRAANRQCLYLEKSRKRGLPEGWVRALEKTWALAFTCVPDLENVLLDTIKDGLREPSRSDFLSIWRNESKPTSLNQSWKASRFLRELERLLPELDHPVSSAGQHQQTGRVKHSHARYKLVPDHNVPVLTASCSVENDPIHPLTQRPGRAQVEPFPPNTPELIELYFVNVQNWLPIMEKHLLYKTYYAWTQKATTFSLEEEACLCSVVALSQLQKHIDLGEQQSRLSAEALHRRARRLVTHDIGPVKLEHVQSMLLMSVFQIGQGNSQNAWLTVGQAARNLLLLRREREKPSSCADTGWVLSTSRVRHVFMATYILDSILSIEIGATPLISKAQLQCYRGVEEDGPEEWAPPLRMDNKTSQPATPSFTNSTFNRHLEIVEFMNELCYEAPQSSSRAETLRELMDRVVSWDSNLPERLSYRLASSECFVSSVSSQQLTLHLLQISTLLSIQLQLRSCTESTYQPPPECETLIKDFHRLLTCFASKHDMATVPTVWKSLCLIIFDYMETVSQPGLDRTIHHDDALTMIRILSSASRVWPAFKSVHDRYSSIVSQAHIMENQEGFAVDGANNTSFQSFLRVDHSPVTDSTPEHHPLDTAQQNNRDNIAVEPNQPIRHEYETPPSLPQGEMLSQVLPQQATLDFTNDDRELGTNYQDLVMLDALNWTESWDQSLEHLGFGGMNTSTNDFSDIFNNYNA